MKKKILFQAFVTLAVTSTSFAVDPPCDPAQTAAPDPVKPELKTVMQSLEAKKSESNATHLIDGTFNWVAIKQDGVVKATNVNTDLAMKSYAKVYDIFRLTTGNPATNTALSSISGKPATNSDEAIKLLKEFSKSMSRDEAILYQSMIGSTLAQCYDYDHLQGQSIEATFQNQKAGTNCGICGSIHEYLAKDASVIGFESAGLNSDIWQKKNDKGKSAENHYTAFFKDPKTRTFLAQNYGNIIDTGMTTLQGAVDVSTQILSPLTGVSYVESKPGVFHPYIPNTARWVEQKLSHPTEAQPAPLITVQASNVESQVALQLQKTLPDQSRVNGFLVHSEYRDPSDKENKFTLDAVGAAIAGNTNYGSALKGMIDEVNVASRIYGGALQVSAPNPLTGERQTRSNLFFGAEQKATAKIDQVTGTLVVEGKTFDFRTPKNGLGTLQIRPGVEWNGTNSPVKVGIERTIDVVPTDSTRLVHPTLRTAYDKISVIYDTSGKEKQVYLVIKGNLYAMEGITKNSATGVQAELETVIPAPFRGKFILAGDLSGFLSNKRKDPFYDTPPAVRAKLEYVKELVGGLKFRASVEASKNRPHSVFLGKGDAVTPGSTTPEIGKRVVAGVSVSKDW